MKPNLLYEEKNKSFTNGKVYCLRTEDGYPIEVTDTFLPYETKFCINDKTNCVPTTNPGDRSERWMIGVSVMSGCPVGCKFCATGKLKNYRKLTADEIMEQVYFILHKNPKYDPLISREFKINFTRMGEPFFNTQNVKKAIFRIQKLCPNAHCFVSTIGVRGADYRWINGDITLQISVHALTDERRKELIPSNRLDTLENLGLIRTNSKLKTTVNLTLVDENDFDIDLLKKYFNPESFFIKLSPLNHNEISQENKLDGVIDQKLSVHADLI